MRNEAAQPQLMARQRVWRCWALGAAFAVGGGAGCATGVGVTEEELAEICAEPNTICGSAGSPIGSVGGSTGAGGSASGGSFGSGGTAPFPSNGGTTSTGTGGSGGTQGASGSGGTGGSAPLAEGECLPTDDILVLYRDRTNGQASTQEPSMVMQVQNPGGTSFPLSDLAIRYWFTADGTSNYIGYVDYATLNGQGNINGSIQISFGQEFGSDYAEMTFPTLSDSVGPEGVRELQLRFHAEPYASMDQTNDFSYLSGAAMLTANRNITPYLRGSQAGGCLPAP